MRGPKVAAVCSSSTATRAVAMASMACVLGLVGCPGGGGGTGSPTTYSISGTVSGAIASGVTIALSGASSATTTSDGKGSYTFTGLSNGSFTVTPSLGGYRFDPQSLPVTVQGADVAHQDFVATPSSSPSAASLWSSDPGSHDFGLVAVKSSSTALQWTITNTGATATSTMSFTCGGANVPDFSYSDGCGGMTLAPSASCTVTIAFQPKAAGTRSASFMVSASSGGSVSLSVTGTGSSPLLVSSDPASHDFGLLAVGSSSAALQWTITNSGDIPTSALGVVVDGSRDFQTNGCQGQTLAPSKSCVVAISFQPSAAGAKSASFAVSDPASNSVSLSVTGSGGWALTVVSTGTGTVTRSPAGVSCGTSCSVYPADTSVTIQARTTNGSGYYFQGFSGGCSGSYRDCAVTLTGNTSVYANFASMVNNLVFVTSKDYAANLGSAAQYDLQCNTAASNAGINNVAGNAFVAWISDPTSNAVARLGSARGWNLLDGRPFTDSTNGLTGSNQVWNPITVDEFGSRSAGSYVMTGTSSAGIYNPDVSANNCAGFTSTSGSVHVGDRGGGPVQWTGSGAWSGCGSSYPIYCFMKTVVSSNLAGQPPAQVGKRIWITRATSASPSGGVPAMDVLCNSEKPAGAVSGKALVATIAAAAASLLSPTTTYYTVDWQLIATGADLRRNALPLLTGVWQRGDRSFVDSNYLSTAAMTGASVVNSAATAATNCNDWSSPSGTHAHGFASSVDSRWFCLNTGYSCSGTYPVYCYEP